MVRYLKVEEDEEEVPLLGWFGDLVEVLLRCRRLGRLEVLGFPRVVLVAQHKPPCPSRPEPGAC